MAQAKIPCGSCGRTDHLTGAPSCVKLQLAQVRTRQRATAQAMKMENLRRVKLQQDLERRRLLHAGDHEYATAKQRQKRRILFKMCVIFHMLSLGHEEIHLDREAMLNRQWEVVEYRRQTLVQMRNWTPQQANRIYKRPSIIPSLSTTSLLSPSSSSTQCAHPQLIQQEQTRIAEALPVVDVDMSRKSISPASYRKFMMRELKSFESFENYQRKRHLILHELAREESKYENVQRQNPRVAKPHHRPRKSRNSTVRLNRRIDRMLRKVDRQLTIRDPTSIDAIPVVVHPVV